MLLTAITAVHFANSEKIKKQSVPLRRNAGFRGEKGLIDLQK